MRIKILFLLFSVFIFSCKNFKTIKDSSFGGGFTIQNPITSVDTGYTNNLNLCNNDAALKENFHSKLLLKSEASNNQQWNNKKDSNNIQKPKNKNIEIGSHLFVGGAAGLGASIALFLTVSTDFMIPAIIFLTWASLLALVTGIVIGFIGWRQLKKRKFSQSGKIRGKIAQWLFWTMLIATPLTIGIIGILTVLFYKGE